MAMDSVVKQEIAEPPLAIETVQTLAVPEKDSAVIDLSSSDSGSPDLDDSASPGVAMAGKQPKALDCAEEGPVKKQKLEVTLPPGFLEPLPAAPLSTPAVSAPPAPLTAGKNREVGSLSVPSCKHFWKAGDYEGDSSSSWEVSSGGMDHVRVHPKFLHSNATSHKWALGAFAELLDNALDEVCNGATYVNVDMLENKKDGSSMLLIEDNGGGMNPDKMRQCMSLGYSVKSKLANTIGQYGNGFKTSTMRLGADVIVFSRCCGQAEKGPTQSIGLLSYTFLRTTGKEDIVVPMLDYERVGNQWKKIQRASVVDWNRNMETVVHWSPYFDEADLLQQFNAMKDHGTRIIIYNLWEDDEQQLELDFYADKHDIQIRGVNRDERNIQMAKQFPNSRHFLTYRHSLRSYVSILYLRLPPNFRIILRGKDVEHHNIVNDMMMSQEVTYRPQPSAIGIPKDSNMIAVVSIGFVKDAKFHIDVQGFNVYHKNRLIKPFWRLWNASGSDGRGVIGVLEANFVEPAHDKQGFERTTVLSRLEARLMQMQKNYWSDNCHKIGYAPRRSRTVHVSAVKGTSPDHLPETALHLKKKAISSSSKAPLPDSYKFSHKHGTKGFEGSSVTAFDGHGNGHICVNLDDEVRANNSSHYKSTVKSSLGNDQSLSALSTPYSANTEATQYLASKERTVQTLTGLQLKPVDLHLNDAGSSLLTMQQLEEENRNLRIRLHSIEGEVLGEILQDLQFERDRSKTLEKQLEETSRKMEEMNKEQDNLIDIFSEERERRNNEEGNLRKKLKEASCTIQELLDKMKLLERVKSEG